ncbi:hypothetical protein MUN81_22465 (plasmid) [Hymenobacter sp. 5317J-9]|uniref:hypothetical protein n=1 Tax=Hymenobacter sp. 5317J-9 TaxID=2932250 RepID=UPI001FD68760|nr:hypothetical protein [Hymenobacter sp. 5317J-9]UOR00208.1 hypothetical protein MUN81_22465 [Hymenobacter sp. 5317J-9]
MIPPVFPSVDFRARLASPRFARWTTLVTLGVLLRSQAGGHGWQQAPVQPVVGEWTLCRSDATSPAKKGLRFRSANVSSLVANVCTEIVFRANGTGEAGLTGGMKYAFTWRQHGDSLTVAYPTPATDATRLQGGHYRVVFTSLPAGRHTTQLTLRTKRGVLYLN